MSYIDSNTVVTCPVLFPPTMYQWMYAATPNLIVAAYTPVILAMSSLGGVAKQCQATRSIVSGHERHQLVLEIENSPHSC